MTDVMTRLVTIHAFGVLNDYVPQEFLQHITCELVFCASGVS